MREPSTQSEIRSSGGANSLPLQRLIESLEQIALPASADWQAVIKDVAAEPGWRFGAVLVPILLHERPSVLLTKRSSRLTGHSGHVSFPGGRPDESDTDIGSTALRESYEEISLERDDVRLIGCLSPHKTRKSRNVVIPVVGMVSPSAVWRPQSAEVEEVFEFPFATLLNPDLPRQYADGDRSGAWYWADQGHDIWGVTARILMSLADAVR